ncbi:diacylglycerol/lipid kinase family protein [Streptomyces sp. NPDC003388]|uniref:diacylglycerol/lipid kinase family protein n=1 Tax=unclassified Streptomyces TaxID=2593676 RepID=UPI0011718BFF|nr:MULTISPECIES: diacylglycerol kinase family protein [unclassified Streptomyces]MDI1453672.1 diacylglycerol kinase family protein [Streptomyces sp. ATE26]GEK00024.1 diacylglycerol kinase [Streptomyces sp. 1-11]
MADTAAPGPTRALIVANPASGSHSPELVRQVAELCEACLERAEVHLTSAPGDATGAVRRALERKQGAPDLVVAIGGDGTVREVVQGLVPATGRASLAVVPGGTGNSGYKMLWGERPWTESLKAVLTDYGIGGSARLRRLDLARLAETRNYVYLGACSGVIADALITARELPLTGRERYARAFADTAAGYRPYPGRVTVDGRVVHEGPTVLANVGGGRYRGGRFQVLPDSLLDDGLLDVCVIGGGIPAADVPGLTLEAAHMDHPATVYARGRRITVERTDGGRLPLEHDGEYQHGIGDSATFEVLPGALPVWAPVTP